MDNAKLYKFCAVLTGIFLLSLLIFSPAKPDLIVGKVVADNVIPMPLVQDSNPVTASLKFNDPKEERGPEFARYLGASVKLSVSGASGSGTIVYYDPIKNEAYVCSCGHMWDGTRTANQLKNNPVNCKIIVWYHNEEKLPAPRTYEAQVIFWSNERGYDSSLLKFTPDWQPNYFPIAALDYPVEMGQHYHSCGCDHAEEVAHYDIEAVEYRGTDLVTKFNSPRPGRSGGGLLTTDGFYIATCWGTSDTNGNGIGYFTSLKAIYKVYEENGYAWLLGLPLPASARSLPIIDRNYPGRTFPPDHLPLPGHDSWPVPTTN